MKVAQDKSRKNSTGLFGLDIGFLSTGFPSRSDIENYTPEVILTFR